MQLPYLSLSGGQSLYYQRIMEKSGKIKSATDGMWM
jgi:hypothetical protein